MSPELDTFAAEQQAVEHLRESRSRIEFELSKVIIGQQEVTEQLLITLFAGGHCLITGAPGLAMLGDYRNRPAEPFNDHEPVDSSAATIAPLTSPLHVIESSDQPGTVPGIVSVIVTDELGV